MNLLNKVKKIFAKEQGSSQREQLEAIQRVNARITRCPHYACAIPGQIYCAREQRFVVLETCIACRREA